MKIYYYYDVYNTYYTNSDNIKYIFKNSELSDFEKYNAIRLLTYYLVYNQFSFKALKKNMEKYNITFKKEKIYSEKNIYLCFVNDNIIIQYNVYRLLDNVLSCKKYNIINMYIALLFNINKYLNIINNEVMYYFTYKIYFLNIEYFKYNKYSIITKKNDVYKIYINK